MPTDRAQDTEAIRAALTRYGASVSEALAALARLVARLEAAERERDEAQRLLAGWYSISQLATVARALDSDPGAATYEARDLRVATRAALAAAAPGETTPAEPPA